MQYRRKKPSPPKCAVTGVRLQGVSTDYTVTLPLSLRPSESNPTNLTELSGLHLQLPARRPQELSNKRLPKRHKTVHRAYGGHLAHGVVRERYKMHLITQVSNALQMIFAAGRTVFEKPALCASPPRPVCTIGLRVSRCGFNKSAVMTTKPLSRAYQKKPSS